MTPRLVPILAGTVASALFLRPALADGPGMTAHAAPRNGWALPVPANGWALPVPANGWGSLSPAGSSATMGHDHDHGDGGDGGDHHHHQGPGIATWPFPYYSGYSATGSQPIIIYVQSPQQPAAEPTGPPRPVPGIDTRPTVEQTPSGVEIVRGPGSS